MPVPAAGASVDVYFDFIEYCSTLLEVDPETKDLEPVLAAPSEKLSKAVTARTVAQRAVNRATALRDYNYRAVGKAVDSLERKASAEFETGKKAPGYLRLFPKTPWQLKETPLESRAKVYGDFLDAAQSRETPAALDKPVKQVAAAWSGYQGAVKRHDAAVAALGKAREKEQGAKQDNVTALRKVEGKLTDRFADDPKRARSYFPPAKPARKKDTAGGGDGAGGTQAEKKKAADKMAADKKAADKKAADDAKTPADPAAPAPK